MHLFKKVTFFILCSFILGYPMMNIKKREESTNGCTSNTYAQYENFYKEKKYSIDVLVIGDSNLYRGFQPLQFWKDEKVSSYVLASPTQPAWLSYDVLQDALQYQTPKVVIFEINELFAKADGHISRNCTVINSLESDEVRLKAIKSTYGGFDNEDREILYRTYAKAKLQETIHHITQDTSSSSTTNNKGYYLNTTTIPLLSGDAYMDRYDVNLRIDKENEEQINHIIALCKEKKIPLLFVKLPTKEWTAQKSKMASNYAKDRKIPLYDMNLDNIVNWKKDTKDNGFHMNDDGAIKVTKKLEPFIKKYVELIPTQDTALIENYDAAYQRYVSLREKQVKENLSNDIK